VGARVEVHAGHLLDEEERGRLALLLEGDVQRGPALDRRVGGGDSLPRRRARSRPTAPLPAAKCVSVTRRSSRSRRVGATTPSLMARSSGAVRPRATSSVVRRRWVRGKGGLRSMERIVASSAEGRWGRAEEDCIVYVCVAVWCVGGGEGVRGAKAQ
jgi:hypothetical protein